MVIILGIPSFRIFMVCTYLLYFKIIKAVERLNEDPSVHGIIVQVSKVGLTLLHSELPKLHRVLAILSAKRLNRVSLNSRFYDEEAHD